MNTRYFLSFLFLLGLLFAPFSNNQAQDGKQIFKDKCVACHSAGAEKLMGPGLAGVAAKRDKEWLFKWIRNSPEMVASGDSLANALFNEFNKIPMLPFPDLTDADIEAILKYIDDFNAAPAPVATASTAAANTKADTEKQVEEWTQVSEGFSSLTLIPLIMLGVLLVVIWLAGQKIPGMD